MVDTKSASLRPLRLGEEEKKERKKKQDKTRMWANAKRDGRPAEYRWRPLFIAAKFGWRPVLHRVSKNVPPLPCYNFDAHEWILIFFGRNVTDKVGNQKTLYYSTSSNLCFCTIWQKAETQKSHISLNWIVLHLCAIFLKETNCNMWCVW